MLKEDTINGKISDVHGLEDLILQNSPQNKVCNPNGNQ
jgi:hypothetical protein